MKIALVTYQDKGLYASPTAENEDDTLLNFLSAKGLTIEKVIWNDPQINWEDYELAILKSPWDYFDLIGDFYEWLELLMQKNVKLLNPADIVRWNADKHYLQDIANAGLNVTPSLYIKKGSSVKLKTYFEALNTTEFIVKPSVSGGSKNTFKVNAGNVSATELKVNDLLLQEDFIIQPFLKEIETHGEWSFLFFGGKYSHALLKKASKGDFRVQHAHGGTIHPQQPAKELIESAQRYVDLFAKDCLYARVDGVFSGNEFMLMELELIEPFLFLNTDKHAIENYYQALLAVVPNLNE